MKLHFIVFICFISFFYPIVAMQRKKERKKVPLTTELQPLGTTNNVQPSPLTFSQVVQPGTSNSNQPVNYSNTLLIQSSPGNLSPRRRGRRNSAPGSPQGSPQRGRRWSEDSPPGKMRTLAYGVKSMFQRNQKNSQQLPPQTSDLIALSTKELQTDSEHEKLQGDSGRMGWIRKSKNKKKGKKIEKKVVIKEEMTIEKRVKHLKNYMLDHIEESSQHLSYNHQKSKKNTKQLEKLVPDVERLKVAVSLMQSSQCYAVGTGILLGLLLSVAVFLAINTT